MLKLFDSEEDANVIGFMLGHGMYTRQAGGTPMMRVKIVLDFQDESLGRYTCISGHNQISRMDEVGHECLWYGVEEPYVADDPFAGATIDWNKLHMIGISNHSIPRQLGGRLFPLYLRFPIQMQSLRALQCHQRLTK